MAAKTYMLKYAATEEFRSIMLQVVKNSRKLAEELTKHGFRIVSGGSDNHIVLADLRPKKLTGKQFEKALEYVGITVNKNMIPFDPEKPFVTSGVRIGTTSISQRGLKEREVVEIARIMNKVAGNVEDQKTLDEARAEAMALIGHFPLYPAGALHA